MRSILVPLDLSDVCTRVIDEAGKLALATGACIRLFYVDNPEFGILIHDPIFREERERFAKRPGGYKHSVEELADGLRSQGITVEARFCSGNPVWQIIREAARTDTHMIVIGSHGHGNFYRFLSGGVGERIRRLARCPVVVVQSEPAELETEVAVGIFGEKGQEDFITH